MSEKMEKYVAKALEGYEANYKGISDAIAQLEKQLSEFKEQRSEMADGIKEMKEVLGLEEEESDSDCDSKMKLVNDFE